jgi:hypothetical protein
MIAGYGSFVADTTLKDVFPLAFHHAINSHDETESVWPHFSYTRKSLNKFELKNVEILTGSRGVMAFWIEGHF